MPLSATERVAFERLYHQHHATVRRLLRSRLGNEDDVEELAQEAFLRVLRYRDCAPDSLRYLLIRTALNLSVSHHLLARCRMPHVPLSSVEIVLDAPGLDEQLDQEQRQQWVSAAIQRLPVRCREVLLLRVIRELSYREIAQHCGISQAAVEKHLARAQAAIRQRLGEG